MSYHVNEKGYYGQFGGAFIPEMLYPNVSELNENYQKIIDFIQNISIQTKKLIVILVVFVVVFQKYILPNEFGTILYILRPTIIALLFCILISMFLPENSSIKIKSKKNKRKKMILTR